MSRCEKAAGTTTRSRGGLRPSRCDPDQFSPATTPQPRPMPLQRGANCVGDAHTIYEFAFYRYRGADSACPRTVKRHGREPGTHTRTHKGDHRGRPTQGQPDTGPSTHQNRTALDSARANDRHPHRPIPGSHRGGGLKAGLPPGLLSPKGRGPWRVTVQPPRSKVPEPLQYW